MAGCRRRAWNRSLSPLFNWETGLDELKPLFDPECPTTIDFAGREEARGRPVVAYRFQSPQDGCFDLLTDGLTVTIRCGLDVSWLMTHPAAWSRSKSSARGYHRGSGFSNRRKS
jgi:hypothetical protein